MQTAPPTLIGGGVFFSACSALVRVRSYILFLINEMSDIYFIGLKVSFVCELTGLIVFCGFNVMAAKSG